MADFIHDLMRSIEPDVRRKLALLKLTPEGRKPPEHQEPLFRRRIESYEGFLREVQDIREPQDGDTT